MIAEAIASFLFPAKGSSCPCLETVNVRRKPKKVSAFQRGGTQVPEP
jgi:hypothetical protein